MALTDDTHHLIRNHFADKPREVAIDATCGNGNDTQFLSELGFARVIAFDIQQVAIDNSTDRILREGLTGVEHVLAGHQDMQQHVNSEVDCVMFNFGYLPNGDKTLTTSAENSVAAILAATALLSDTGLISLMCYPGHPAGAIETEAIIDCLKKLNRNWQVGTHLAVSPRPTAPILYTLKQQ